MTTEGSWTETNLAGHLVDVFEPATPSPHNEVVVYLHGVHLKRLHENETYRRRFDALGLRVVAPMTQRSWWTDRVCNEFDQLLTAERHLLDNVLAYVDERWQATPPSIALLGTSMGGQGALRFAFKHPSIFPVVAAISPAIDYQSRLEEGDPTLAEMYRDAEAARQDTATLHVHPLNWPRNIWFSCDPTDVGWHTSADKLRMKLAALGIPHECDLETESGGHGWSYYDHMAEAALGFIVERLEQERRRIV